MVTATPQLVFFGNSVFLAGIKAELKKTTHAELITVEAECPDAEGLIRRRDPMAVIFDLSTGHPDLVVSLLQDKPGLRLIGVAPSSNEMLLLSSQPVRAESVQDLLHVVNTCAAVSHPPTRVPDLARLPRFASTAGVLIPTRQQKLAFALAGIIVCMVFVLGLALAGSNTSAPLVGTATASGSGSSVVTFAAGIALGGIGISLWLHCNRQKKDNS